MLKKILLCLLLISIVGLNYMRYGKQPAPFEQHTYSYQMQQPGPFEFLTEDIELIDYQRSTMPSGKFPGSDTRKLITRLWLPIATAPRKPAPLLIYNHGFLSTRVGGTYLARHLASHGYIVAAMDFPLTNMESAGPQQAMDVVNQPGDVAFVIDQLLERNSDESNPLYNAIDPARIANAGMSLGGMTASLIAFHPTLSDQRIAAAISIAGPSYLFLKPFYRYRNIPFMMIASPIDPVVNYQANASPIPERVKQSVLVTIDEASHAGFSFQARALRWLHNPDQIGCWAITSKRKQEAPWYELIGTREQGVLQQRGDALCTQKTLPKAMNPIQQQRLTALAATSFLQSLFASDPSVRARHRDFLYRQFPDENKTISIRTSRTMD